MPRRRRPQLAAAEPGSDSVGENPAPTLIGRQLLRRLDQLAQKAGNAREKFGLIIRAGSRDPETDKARAWRKHAPRLVSRFRAGHRAHCTRRASRRTGAQRQPGDGKHCACRSLRRDGDRRPRLTYRRCGCRHPRRLGHEHDIAGCSRNGYDFHVRIDGTRPFHQAARPIRQGCDVAAMTTPILNTTLSQGPSNFGIATLARLAATGACRSPFLPFARCLGFFLPKRLR